MLGDMNILDTFHWLKSGGGGAQVHSPPLVMSLLIDKTL